eukprot:TRINITY_DN4861_c0_g2_i4.p1 TRINITY_DN4861_c0_g2~~TRINITY_DN4861_c0_g2_i4.p1  ORF type:complete len:1199 (-),score=295.81 TRINITY_DN4861_c0_g2_i4:303-3899(-)
MFVVKTLLDLVQDASWTEETKEKEVQPWLALLRWVLLDAQKTMDETTSHTFLLLLRRVQASVVHYGSVFDLYCQLLSQPGSMLTAGGALVSGNVWSVMAAAVQQLNSDLFRKLSVNQQETILKTLVHSVTSTTAQQARLNSLVTRALAPLNLHSAVLCTLINIPASAAAADNSWFKHHVVVLEWLQAKNDVTQPQTLITRLFDLLAFLLSLDPSVYALDDGSVPITEYCKQLVVSAIGFLLSEFSKHGGRVSNVPAADTLLESQININAVVECVGSSDNSQTRNQALLLLATLSSVCPNLVMDAIIPVFTYVGQSVISQRDDSYTFIVVQQTMETVLPIVTRSADFDVARLILIFVQALPSIPAHRRLSLFSVLLTTLSSSSLHIALALLLARHTQLSESEVAAMPVDGENQFSYISFAHQILFEFSAVDQVTAMAGLAGFVDIQQADLSEFNVAITSVEVAMSAQKHHEFNLAVAEFLCFHLPHSQFLEKLLSITESESLQLRQLYLNIFEVIFIHLKRLTTQHAVLAQESAQVRANGPLAPGVAKLHQEALKYRKQLTTQFSLALNYLNGLLSVEGFVKVVRQLLTNPDPQIRRKTVQLVTEKVKSEQTRDSEQAQLLVDLIPSLLPVLDQQEPDQGDSEADLAVGKQTVLCAIDTMCLMFAKKIKNPEQFLSAMPALTKCLEHKHNAVVSSALLCIASFISELGVSILPFVPVFFPLVVSILDHTLALVATHNESQASKKSRPSGVEQKEGLTEDSKLFEGVSVLLGSVLGAVEMAVLQLPQFLSTSLSNLLKCLVHPVLQDAALAGDKALLLVVDNIFHHLAERVSPSVLLPHIFATLMPALSLGDASLKRVFALLGECCGRMDREQVKEHYKTVFKFYLKAFDLRKAYGQQLSDVDDVEGEVVTSFVKLVLKLNESQLKPLFLKTIDWVGLNSLASDAAEEDKQAAAESSNSLSGLSRSIVLFRVVNSLTEKLQSIFVPYFNYLMDHCVTYLSYSNPDPSSNLVSSENPVKKAKKRKSIAAPETPSNPLCHYRSMLAFYVVSSIHKSFLYDDVEFLDKDKFERLLKPLVGQLVISIHDRSLQDYTQYIEQTMVPCLSQLAVRLGNETLWKPLHNEVLLKTRDHNPHVRLSALKVVEELFTRIGMPYLGLLPETLPFLSELQEDDDVYVEQLCQRIIKHIENLSGESLESLIRR